MGGIANISTMEGYSARFIRVKKPVKIQTERGNLYADLMNYFLTSSRLHNHQSFFDRYIYSMWKVHARITEKTIISDIIKITTSLDYMQGKHS